MATNLVQPKPKKPAKMSRKAKKAQHKEALRVLEQNKRAAAQAEVNMVRELAAKIVDHEKRIGLLEQRAGVPGPQGERGPKGSGFWG